MFDTKSYLQTDIMAVRNETDEGRGEGTEACLMLRPYLQTLRKIIFLCDLFSDDILLRNDSNVEWILPRSNMLKERTK